MQQCKKVQCPEDAYWRYEHKNQVLRLGTVTCGEPMSIFVKQTSDAPAWSAVFYLHKTSWNQQNVKDEPMISYKNIYMNTVCIYCMVHTYNTVHIYQSYIHIHVYLHITQYARDCTAYWKSCVISGINRCGNRTWRF